MKQILILIAVCISFNHYAQENKLVCEIPFKLIDNHIYIPLKINDSEELEFVFDTGAGATIINSNIQKQINLTSNKVLTSNGATGEVNMILIENNTIKFDSLELNEIDLLSTSLSHLERASGRNIDGIIGYDFLNKYVVEINYNDSKILIFDPKGFKYQGKGQLIKIDVDKLPKAKFKFSINNRISFKGEFIIDTGAGGTIGFATHFSKKNDLKHRIEKTYSFSSKGLSGNHSIIDIGRIKEFKISEFGFKNIPVRIYNTNKGALAKKKTAGIIGNELLKKFNITFDYKSKKSYWTLNHKFNEPFVVSHSGLKLELDTSGTKVIITYIIPNSVAESSDLNIGDEIIEIDNLKVSSISLDKIRKLLNQNGKTIEIKYLKGNEIKILNLILKPMI